jgi:hypothetical protein
MASEASVIIAGFAGMDLVTRREVVVAKLCLKLALMLHSWVNPSKEFLVHGMKHALIPLEMVLVVCNEGGKMGLCACRSGLEMPGDGDAINRYCYSTLRVKGNLRQRGGVFFELHCG